MMRLFIALALPDEVQDILAAQQDHLRGVLGSNERAVRWVDTESAHLTLQFLGETEDSMVPSILAVVQQHEATSQLALNLDRAGAFPTMRRPQTLWCGVGGDVAALRIIQQSMAVDLQPLGFVPDTRGFSPHLTLGRVRREATSQQVAAIGQAVQELPAPLPCAWECGPPILFQSMLTPRGAVYTRMG
jgi:RNA 2',3'-cyclic 3'-phosphodiesterase